MKIELISIIIATYNSEYCLEYCLESIINQSYRSFELIIIDGKSTDCTVDILNKYDKYLTYWVSEKDDGIYDAWNKGLKVAKGQWITFIGSDDSFCPDALIEYANYLNCLNDTGVEYISSKLDLVNKNRQLIKTIGYPWDWKTCRLQNVVAHPGSLHKRELFEKYGLFDTKYKICGDFEFLLRPGKDLKSAFLNKVTVEMQQGGVSTFSADGFKEHYLAATTTGKLSLSIGMFFLLYQTFKFYLKSLIRKVGFSI